MSEARCGNCFFWRETFTAAGVAGNGQCRHDLPATIQMQTQKQTVIDHGRRPGEVELGLQVIAFWPTVHVSNWCGKWRRRAMLGKFLRGLVGR